ncbi:hypothetical protein GGQ07_003222 [Salinibacter ruber]|nr:hypothetical protein [Salinibacter ruber]MCS4181762.1 hypothetical protein [Salinibacter ruber]
MQVDSCNIGDPCTSSFEDKRLLEATNHINQYLKVVSVDGILRCSVIQCVSQSLPNPPSSLLPCE